MKKLIKEMNIMVTGIFVLLLVLLESEVAIALSVAGYLAYVGCSLYVSEIIEAKKEKELWK